MAVTISDVRARIETDLDDATLQRILDAAVKSIARAAGNATSEIEVHDATGAEWLALARRSASFTSITERRRHSSDSVTLSTNDYRKVGDYRLLRLTGGDNPAGFWGAEVIVTYVPEVDATVRDRVTLDICQIDVEFRALDREKLGDDYEGEQRDWKSRRRELFAHIREGRSLVV